MEQDYIEILGAKENNLKNINLKIPKKRITIFTGVSGSGKSSIVFNTLAQEAGRQLNQTYSTFIRGFLPKYNQPSADSIRNLSTAIVIDQKRLGGNSRSTLGTISEINPLLRLLFSHIGKPFVGASNHFSFNDPSGMCKECDGIGKNVTLDINKAIDMEKSLNVGAILLPGFAVGSYNWKMYVNTNLFDNDKKIKDFTKEEFEKLIYAKPEKVSVKILVGEVNSTYESLIEKFTRLHIKTDREESWTNQKKITKFTTICQCPACGGKRYNEAALSSKILEYSIYDLTQMQITDLVDVLKRIDNKLSEPIVKNLIKRLKNIINIGLDYVSLNRESSTLQEENRKELNGEASIQQFNRHYVYI